ncbi:MAG: hypothetical protein ACXVAI_06410 [Candidatus Limnocylindrales bacterium]
MDIQLAEQRIFVLEERLSFEEIRQRAMDRRTGAFASGLGSLLQRPKADDIVLLDSQRRLEPFWHVACRARYVYDRSRDYTVPASGAEVREVTVNGETYPVGDAGRTARAFVVPTVEHCREEFGQELFADGLTGQPVADAATLIAGPREEVIDLAGLSENETIVVPPEHRASFVVRQLLAQMLKPVQADTVTEESLTLEKTDLYYRPLWAFEFHWKPKDRRGVVELDAVTGRMRAGESLMPKLTRMVTRDALFDIGADTVGLLVPGGGIAVKVAKIALDQTGKS